jgi:hypothetical protein
MEVQFQETIVTEDDPSYDGLLSAQIAAVLDLVVDNQTETNPRQVDRVKRAECRDSSNPSATIQKPGRGD